MRRALEGFYRLTGGLAAGFLFAILVIVLAQVVLNVADWFAETLTGEPVGLLIPSYADFAGYFLAAATFFALAYSFRRGAHIRVNLVLLRLPARAQHAAEIWASALAAAIAGYFTWYMALLTHESWRFGDLSPGLVAIPIWIPQAAMTTGAAALTIACLHSLFEASTGETPAHAEERDTLDMSADSD